MNVLFVPSLGLDLSLIERLAGSVDYPVQYKVVLNNGPTGALEGFGNTHPDWYVKEPPTGNLGVAGSWNWIAKMLPDSSILIMNEDAWFLPGYLEKIIRCADENPNVPIIHLNDSNAFYAFVWNPNGREEIGLFDENLWPAYMEDNDYRVRMKLKGITTHPYALQGLEPLPHGKPRSGGINYSSLIQGTGLLNRAYWKRKWGSLDFDTPLYQTPYKDHRLTVKDIVWYPEHRAELYPLWREFINQPNPSIYE